MSIGQFLMLEDYVGIGVISRESCGAAAVVMWGAGPHPHPDVKFKTPEPIIHSQYCTAVQTIIFAKLTSHECFAKKCCEPSLHSCTDLFSHSTRHWTYTHCLQHHSKPYGVSWECPTAAPSSSLQSWHIEFVPSGVPPPPCAIMLPPHVTRPIFSSTE